MGTNAAAAALVAASNYVTFTSLSLLDGHAESIMLRCCLAPSTLKFVNARQEEKRVAGNGSGSIQRNNAKGW